MIAAPRRSKPAWALTDIDVERMVGRFARTLAIALVDELVARGLATGPSAPPQGPPA
jgi:hypothetical protein